MTNLLRISDAATIGLHTVAYLARMSKVSTNREIAATLCVSGAHLSKVLQRLEKAGIVQSVRGPKGGFRLSPAGADATLLELFEAIEGRLTPTTCLLGNVVCTGGCMLGDLLSQVNSLVMGKLSGAKVSDLAKHFEDKTALAG